MKKFRFKPLEFKATPFDPKETLPGVEYKPELGYYIDTMMDGRVYLEPDDWILYNSREQPLVVKSGTFDALFEEIK